MPSQGRRRLAAIMFTDIVGYSRVMQSDETRGRLLRERHKQVFEQCTNRYDGKIVQYFGDGTLSVFDSAVSAVECAVCMQKSLKTYPQVPLRIGIHLGDIHYDETEVYGHGVNVAARIEPVCNPGGVFVSDKVYDEIQNHPWLDAKSIGVFGFKNMEQGLSLYAIKAKDVTMPNAEDIQHVRDSSKAVHFSKTGHQSRAIQRFLRDKKKQQRQRVGRVAAITLVAMLAIAAMARLGFQNNPVISAPLDLAAGQTSIAVLPFANMTIDQENEYFSDGMTEDILTKLSKIEGFLVTSRTSVMQYKATTKTTREIARELGVDHILEGSVRRDGDKVRITAQLIDARNDAHLWAHTYDEELTNIFDVQSQVATDIADHLKIQLSDEDLEKMRFDENYDVAAYDTYLKGREYYRKYTQEDNDKAISMFNEALEIEPNFAYAYAGLGDAYAQRANANGMNALMLDTAVLMSAKAVEADPKLSEGYKALGLAFHYQGKIDEAITQYEKALELDPRNDMAANNLGMIQKMNGEYVEAAKWAHKTFEINKNIPASAANMAGIYMEVGDDENAEEVVIAGLEVNPDAQELQAIKGELEIRRGDYSAAQTSARSLVKMAPDKPVGYDILGNAYLYKGDWKNASDNYRQAAKHCSKEVDKVRYKALVTFADGKDRGATVDAEVWDEMLLELEDIEDPEGHYKQTIAIIRAALDAQKGDVDAALKNIEVAYESNWMDYKSGLSHPVFSEIRDLPEFQFIMDEIKIRSDSIRFEVISATQNDGT